MQQSLSALSDEKLMEIYQQGNDGAFEILYGRHSARVYGFLKTRFQDKGAVDDAFQLTFLKLHQARAQFDPAFPFAPWLFSICRSALAQQLRKTKRNREDSSPESELELLAVAAAGEAQCITAGASSEATLPPARDRLALDRLSEDQRMAVELRYFEELPFDEIARRLEKSEGNIRQLVSRGVRKLRAGIIGDGGRQK